MSKSTVSNSKDTRSAMGDTAAEDIQKLNIDAKAGF